MTDKYSDKILDFREINKGSKIRLVPVDSVIYDNGTIVYKDGTIEKNGVITKQNPINVAPIQIEYNGELLEGAYIHLPDWINEENVRADIALDKQKLLELRKKVLDNNGLETVISNRTEGWLLEDKQGFINKNY